MRRAPALLAAALAALAVVPPAQPFDGAVEAHGTGLLRTYEAATGQLLCEDVAVISIVLVFGEVEVGDEDAPTGYYASASSCASFVYPIETAYECTGAPGAAIACAETGPPRSFTLDTAGNFVYLRDNLGAHFELTGALARTDVPQPA